MYKQEEGEVEKVLFAEYFYDLNGNTTKRLIHAGEGDKEINFEYDTMNRLIRTVEGADVTKYFYDNAGNRFIKKMPDGSLTLYLRHGQIAVAMDIEIMGDQTVEKGKINRYVLSGDLLAGRVTLTVDADDSTVEAKSWYHLDHLNSTKCVTDEAGVLQVMYEYRAFGEQLKRLDGAGNETGDEAKYSYGGKELDDGTELYYFNARYYDATIGRFINVDPIQDGTNWYVYCSNNPLTFVDPTGLSSNKSNGLKYYDYTERTMVLNKIDSSTIIDTIDRLDKKAGFKSSLKTFISDVATGVGAIPHPLPSYAGAILSIANNHIPDSESKEFRKMTMYLLVNVLFKHDKKFSELNFRVIRSDNKFVSMKSNGVGYGAIADNSATPYKKHHLVSYLLVENTTGESVDLTQSSFNFLDSQIGNDDFDAVAGDSDGSYSYLNSKRPNLFLGSTDNTKKDAE